MVFTEFIILIAEIGFTISGPVPGKHLINVICHHMVFLGIPCMLATLWLYIQFESDGQPEKTSPHGKTFGLVFASVLAIVILNPVTNWLFSVGPDNTFSRPFETFAVFAALIFILMLLCIIQVYNRVSNPRDRLHYYIAFFILAATCVLQALHPASNNISMGLLFITLLVYGNSYTNHGYELFRKKLEARNMKQNLYISQLQPRFIKTTLDNIRDLPGNPPEMKTAIGQFSKYLNDNFVAVNDKCIPFDTELEHVQTYVGLEKLRFKEKLEVVFDIGDTDFDIPPLTLQMIVENAIKHGITQSENGGTVEISSRMTASDHVITVKDDGIGFDPEYRPEESEREHVGIVNSRKRLSEILGGKLTVESEIGKGTTITITIPRHDTNRNVIK